jgi:hypothetical protein
MMKIWNMVPYLYARIHHRKPTDPRPQKKEQNEKEEEQKKTEPKKKKVTAAQLRVQKGALRNCPSPKLTRLQTLPSLTYQKRWR